MALLLVLTSLTIPHCVCVCVCICVSCREQRQSRALQPCLTCSGRRCSHVCCCALLALLCFLGHLLSLREVTKRSPSWIANSVSQGGLLVRWGQMGKGVGFPTRVHGQLPLLPYRRQEGLHNKETPHRVLWSRFSTASWEHRKIQYQPGVVGFATWLAGKLVNPMTSGLDHFVRQFNWHTRVAYDPVSDTQAGAE